MAQEQANSIVEGSAAVQQGPHQPQDFVVLSAGRGKQGASRKCGSSNGYAMAPLLGDYRFCFLSSSILNMTIPICTTPNPLFTLS